MAAKKPVAKKTPRRTKVVQPAQPPAEQTPTPPQTKTRIRKPGLWFNLMMGIFVFIIAAIILAACGNPVPTQTVPVTIVKVTTTPSVATLELPAPAATRTATAVPTLVMEATATEGVGQLPTPVPPPLIIVPGCPTLIQGPTTKGYFLIESEQTDGKWLARTESGSIEAKLGGSGTFRVRLYISNQAFNDVQQFIDVVEKNDIPIAEATNVPGFPGCDLIP